jgi:hypothetical protein
MQARAKLEVTRKRVRDLLGFIYMIVKFNSHAIDEPIMNEIIRYAYEVMRIARSLLPSLLFPLLDSVLSLHQRTLNFDRKPCACHHTSSVAFGCNEDEVTLTTPPFSLPSFSARRHTCVLCNSAREVEDMQVCLDVLDVYVRYGFFSITALPFVIEALSRAVNIEKFCHSSWQIMKSVLKSDVCPQWRPRPPW